MFSLYITNPRGFIYLSVYLLLSFRILFLLCTFNLLRSFYIFMYCRCCILCAFVQKYILDIGCLLLPMYHPVVLIKAVE